MRWSDMRERPDEEARAAQAMLARLGWVLAAAMGLVVLLLAR
ncbi:morphogenic membrane protein MmpB [Streptomyces johnsoniae]|uniref:Uncharacterized protein n=1 Tax=Streptomyces johnsoniae TaxID=3075532 RepID=A0ABU2SEA7_9ACTN|nr:hypothetical protein [Streptomyces sp. DSM 41886]MDT0447001.1 hypothetical protein [Streptomyces sp. DSM 41886]